MFSLTQIDRLSFGSPLFFVLHSISDLKFTTRRTGSNCDRLASLRISRVKSGVVQVIIILTSVLAYQSKGPCFQLNYL